MLTILAALTPIFAMIAIGHYLKRSGFITAPVWRDLDRLNFYLLMPALVFFSLIKADLSQLELAPMAGALLASFATMVTVMFAAKPVLGLDGPRFTSVFQGATRWNGFVALATVSALYGEAGLAGAGIALAITPPFLLLVTIWVLTTYGQGTRLPAGRLFAQLLRNPLLIACLAGGGFQALGLQLPGVALDTLSLLAKASLPLGLMAVGSGIALDAFRTDWRLLSFVSALKLLAMPLFISGYAILVGLDGVGLQVALVVGAVPPATASYVMARQMGGDAPLMANILTASTLGATLTMPVMIALLG